METAEELYQTAMGVTGTSAEGATEMLRQAAEMGSAEAMAELGERYAEGRYTKRNYDEALRWYTKAHKARNGRATRWLIDYYREIANKKRLVETAEEGAEWGDAHCIVIMADARAEGTAERDVDLEEAMRWIEKLRGRREELSDEEIEVVKKIEGRAATLRERKGLRTAFKICSIVFSIEQYVGVRAALSVLIGYWIKRGDGFVALLLILALGIACYLATRIVRWSRRWFGERVQKMNLAWSTLIVVLHVILCAGMMLACYLAWFGAIFIIGCLNGYRG
ncbi:MAG: sel1 repeat family protein [Bacteroidales bacterium]|nr:sel1 repeat family protein [Bacteroidales bacterium]